MAAINVTGRSIRHGLGWRFWLAVAVGMAFAILYVSAGCYFDKVCY